MNLPDGNQLVRESSGYIEEQNSIRKKMGVHAKLTWIALFFCLGLIALAHCIPIEIIYTGQGCEYPSKLDYSVNVPSVPKPKKYIPNEYGYRVDVPTPRQAKAKVTYSFDFSVEEPRPPKPVKPTTKLNLFAKVDRIAMNKGDYEDSYAAPSAPSACRCGQCGISNPLYRYVFNNMAPTCNCRRPNCQCNRSRATSTPYSTNAIFMGPPLSDLMPLSKPLKAGDGNGNGDDGYVNNGSGGVGAGAVNTRRKRDLQHTLFRPRKLTSERSGRFVKLYHKNLSEKPHRLFNFEGPANKRQHSQQIPKKMKRKAKKTHYTHQRSRLVKRDIKGEYEMLEKEREQMDLTLPEIIQFMPETLQPNFKRGQCYFGCGSQRSNQSKRPQSNPGTTNDSNYSPSSTEYSVNSKQVSIDNPAVITTYTDNNNNSRKDGIIDMSLDVTTNGDVGLSGDVDTDGDIDTGGDVDTGGNVDTDGDVDTGGNVDTGGDVDTDGDVDTGGNVDTGRDVDTDGDVDIGGNVDTYTTIDNAQFPQHGKATSIEESLLNEIKDSSAQNAISTSCTKRNAANYNSGRSTPSAESAYSRCRMCMPTLLKKRADRAHLSTVPPISINPIYKPQKPTYAKTAYSAAPPTAHAATSRYFYDNIGRKYLKNNDQSRDVGSTISVPDPVDGRAMHLRYDGDLEAHPWVYSSYPQDELSVLSAQHYPVQYINNEQLDQIIADILFRHPAFMEATSHLDGSLVDPEPLQEQETKEFIKKLIEGRLSLRFGQEYDHDDAQLDPQLPSLF
ncbi:uncharacterized protein LOC128856332 [Anastrepha ludens]|uniref:uncharacterized protein LOC128856332 n=1 Tax=Anastrepha ludens TaxID=28586 RepID=UPI0023AF6D41|nr:uncharacterized protein LOC128856332 [Anastrepha ludens]